VRGRLPSHVAGIELQKHRAGIAGPGTVGDDDLIHALCVLRHLLPDAQRLEHAAGTRGDGGGAAIETVAGEAARVLGIDENDVERAFDVAPAEAQGGSQPVQRGADDENVG